MERDKRVVKSQLPMSVFLIGELKSVQENPLPHPLDLTACVNRQLQTAALIRVVTQHMTLCAKYS